MADIKRFLGEEALGTLVDQIKAEDAKALQAAKDYCDGKDSQFESAGAAATALTDAKAYTDQLANGAVATNTAAITKLNGDATTEGSVAKAVADAQATLQASIDATDAIADKNAEDIAAINDGTNGILAQAKAFATSEDAKVQANVDELAELVGEIPEGYEATTVTGYVAEVAENIIANGYDDAPLTAKVDANTEAITALQTKDNELVAKDEELQAAIDSVTEDVNAFLAAAEVGDAAVDTLKEIQEYITSDGTAAATMTANIQANADAIDALETAGATQDEKIAALEAKFGGAEGSVEDLIADAKQEAIDTAAGDATTKANTAEANAKAYTDTEVGKDRARLDALEAIDHEHSNKELLDTYTQTEANLADAVAKKHEHSNLTVLEGITEAKVTAWDAAEQNAKNYADGLNTTMQGVVDGVAARVGTLETTITEKADADDLGAAVERIAKNETDIATLTSSVNSFTAITSDEVNALFA